MLWQGWKASHTVWKRLFDVTGRALWRCIKAFLVLRKRLFDKTEEAFWQWWKVFSVRRFLVNGWLPGIYLFFARTACMRARMLLCETVALSLSWERRFMHKRRTELHEYAGLFLCGGGAICVGQMAVGRNKMCNFALCRKVLRGRRVVTCRM